MVFLWVVFLPFLYRIKTPEDGFVKITTPDGAVKVNADGRSTLGKPSTGTGSGADDGVLVGRNGNSQIPAMVMGGGGGPGGGGRPVGPRGRFSESWKRISSRGGSTKRGALNAQQPPVRRFGF